MVLFAELTASLQAETSDCYAQAKLEFDLHISIAVSTRSYIQDRRHFTKTWRDADLNTHVQVVTTCSHERMWCQVCLHNIAPVGTTLLPSRHAV